jgi:hypothetical protein
MTTLQTFAIILSALPIVLILNKKVYFAVSDYFSPKGFEGIARELMTDKIFNVCRIFALVTAPLVYVQIMWLPTFTIICLSLSMISFIFMKVVYSKLLS